MGICYVVGAGDCSELPFKPEKGDIVIAADAGYLSLKKAGIKPDVVIGDFDSLGFVPSGEEVVRLKPEKDRTDTSAAAALGVGRGFKDFRIYGALGGRIDHSIANIQLLASLARDGFSASIIDGKTVITAVCNSSLKFDSSFKGFASVFSLSDECSGVCLRGLKYPLENATLKNTFPLGTSNEFTGEEGEIIVGRGIAAAVYTSDKVLTLK